MIQASVIGWPISHSRSPLIHGYWLKKYGIDGSYTKEAVPPDQLENFIQSLRTGERVGTNVTMPHKEAARPFVDEPDERVRSIGALNTIWRQDGKLHATSTDGPGFIANVQQSISGYEAAAEPITILGAGGSARSLIDELLRHHADRIYIHNRTQHRAEELAEYFGPKVKAITSSDMASKLTQTGLLINTTSAGMNHSGELSLPWSELRNTAVVADIVYTPLITTFLEAAASRGHRIVPGLGMLLHQAVVGFEKWFAVRPEVTPELYDIIAHDIDPNYQP